MSKKKIKVSDISKPSKKLSPLNPEDFKPLPPPYDTLESLAPWKPLKEPEGVECSLDDTLLLNLPKPETKEEEQELVQKFLSGLEKLFTKENNWPFLQQLTLTMDHCAKCQTCSDSCHMFEMSGRNEIYRPTYRAEVVRRIYFKYLKPGGKFFGKLAHGDIDLNWTTVARLAELAYRCNIDRRCA